MEKHKTLTVVTGALSSYGITGNFCYICIYFCYAYMYLLYNYKKIVFKIKIKKQLRRIKN